MVRKIHREAQFEGAGSTSGAATGRGIVQAAMSQLQQGINGQGVPGNLFPKAPWRTSPTNQGPSIDGRDDVEEGDSAAQAQRDQFWQDALLEERKAAAAAHAQQPKSVSQPPPRAARPPFGPAAGVAAELRRIHPDGLLQVSPGVEARCNAHGWSLEHLGATIGTIIHNAALKRPQTDDEIETMYALLLERKVICFRDQNLTEEEQMSFGLRFGSLEIFPWALRDGPRVDGVEGESHPGILPQISRGKIASGASGFHSDVTWRKSPSLGSLLYCDVAPPFGGGTAFADTLATFQGLKDDDREMLRGCSCVHDFDTFRQGQLAQGVSPETVEAVRKAYPVARHPMVRTHPDTGAEMLYVNPNFGRYVELADGTPMDAYESDLLLERLYAQAFNMEYQCVFTYQPGDMAFWDNRSCMHRAIVDFSPHERILRRVTLQGDIPYYDPRARHTGSEEAAAAWLAGSSAKQQEWVAQANL